VGDCDNMIIEETAVDDKNRMMLAIESDEQIVDI
jgi:hypothetical protein